MRRARWLRPTLLAVGVFTSGSAGMFPSVSSQGYFPTDPIVPTVTEEPPLPTPVWVFSLDRLPERPHVDLAHPAEVADFGSFFSLDRPGREPRKIQTKTDSDWGAVTSNVVLDAPPAWEDPLARREWKRADAVKVPVAGPFFVYGEVGAASQEAAQQDMTVSHKTGLACKLPVGTDGEIVMRSGPSVTYTDPLRPDRVKEKSEWLLEVQARWPVLAGIGLEYQGVAAPALTPLDRDWINQDLGFALPFGTGGKLRLGARHHWENTATPKALSDGMQLYLGVEWAR